MSEHKTTRRDFLKKTDLTLGILTIGLPDISPGENLQDSTNQEILTLLQESTKGLYNQRNEQERVARSLFEEQNTIFRYAMQQENYAAGVLIDGPDSDVNVSYFETSKDTLEYLRECREQGKPAAFISKPILVNLTQTS